MTLCIFCTKLSIFQEVIECGTEHDVPFVKSYEVF